MNYQLHYDNLIKTRKTRACEPAVYYERHHILPKCLGGTNEHLNIVKLTAREHFLAHWLLWRIHKDGPYSKSMAFAFHSMCRGNKKQNRITSARGYEEAKKAMRLSISAIMKNNATWKDRKQTEAHIANRLASIKRKQEENLKLTGRKRKEYSVEALQNIKDAAKKSKTVGKNKSPMKESTKKHLSEIWKGVPKSEETKERMSKAKKGCAPTFGFKGQTHSNISKDLMSNSLKNSPSSFVEYVCPFCEKPGIGRSFKGHHFDNCKFKPLPDDTENLGQHQVFG